MNIKLEDLKKWGEAGYKVGKALHKMHKNNLKNGYVDIHLKNVVENMTQNAKSFREYKKHIKDLEEEIYQDRRKNLKIIG